MANVAASPGSVIYKKQRLGEREKERNRERETKREGGGERGRKRGKGRERKPITRLVLCLCFAH